MAIPYIKVKRNPPAPKDCAISTIGHGLPFWVNADAVSSMPSHRRVEHIWNAANAAQIGNSYLSKPTMHCEFNT